MTSLAKKLARKMNPINFTIELLNRYRIKDKIATIADRMVCDIAIKRKISIVIIRDRSYQQ